MADIEIVQVKNVLTINGTPTEYAGGYDGQRAEFKPGETKSLPETYAKRIVERSYIAGQGIYALEIVRSAGAAPDPEAASPASITAASQGQVPKPDLAPEKPKELVAAGGKGGKKAK